jgi:hypothetical protein
MEPSMKVSSGETSHMEKVARYSLMVNTILAILLMERLMDLVSSKTSMVANTKVHGKTINSMVME